MIVPLPMARYSSVLVTGGAVSVLMPIFFVNAVSLAEAFKVSVTHILLSLDKSCLLREVPSNRKPRWEVDSPSPVFDHAFALHKSLGREKERG